MKYLLILYLLACSACAEAKTMRFHRRRLSHKPTPYKLSWKQIAAGGAAAGTVVAAYKISNGMENGMEKAAEKEPRVFLGLWTYLSSLLMAAGAFALYKWFHNLKKKG